MDVTTHTAVDQLFLHKVNEVSGSSAFKKEKGCGRRGDCGLIRATEDHVIITSSYRSVQVWGKYPSSYCWKPKELYCPGKPER